jgi:hypothetical protein
MKNNLGLDFLEQRAYFTAMYDAATNVGGSTVAIRLVIQSRM